MKRQLPKNFFDRNVVEVAINLIGCNLVRKNGRKIERFMITETEAYNGVEDLACHASKGRTARTEIMFGPSGHIYIYLVYGMHWMLNIVTDPKDYPSAVLIRGVDNINGPARVTKKLGINKSLNGKKLGQKAGLWIEKGDKVTSPHLIHRTPRIGVDYAGPIWSKREWRFMLTTYSDSR